MRIEDLQFFLKAVELNSLSAAGRTFNLSPAAASARLSNLEKAAGTALLVRTTRSLSLTEAGAIFLEHAQRAVSEMQRALTDLEATAEEPRGRLRISSNQFFGRKHILPYLREFMDLFPAIRLELRFTDRMVNLVEEGYDLAIRAGPMPDSSLLARKLAENPRVLCASPEYVARKGMPQRPEELTSHDCIGYDMMPIWYFSGPDGEIVHRVTSSITGDSGDYAYDAALSGLGLTIKSLAHVWEDLRDGRLVAVMENYPVARTGAIWAVYPGSEHVPPKVRVFVDFLKSKYGPNPYWQQRYKDLV